MTEGYFISGPFVDRAAFECIKREYLSNSKWNGKPEIIYRCNSEERDKFPAFMRNQIIPLGLTLDNEQIEMNVTRGLYMLELVTLDIYSATCNISGREAREIINAGIPLSRAYNRIVKTCVHGNSSENSWRWRNEAEKIFESQGISKLKQVNEEILDLFMLENMIKKNGGK